jgi:hypothetical protein
MKTKIKKTKESMARPRWKPEAESMFLLFRCF